MTEEQGVTRRQRRTSVQIEQMVREFRDSGLTGRQFCLREGLSPSMLYRYLRRTASGEIGGGDGLVAVELASRKPGLEAGGCGLAVVLAGGRRIAVSAGFDGVTLRRLVQTLETM
jgi:hypothetical protein